MIGFFESERQPVLAKEVPSFLDLIACSRIELLEMTRPLPVSVLAWQPALDSWSIQEVLRHVAAAERWSARKVFRRYLEHEREHTHHILEILEQYSQERDIQP